MSSTTSKNFPLQNNDNNEEEEEDDYVIDMESKEFEFLASHPSDKSIPINTADDLFYKGKLLPLLLLPSRRQMLDFTKMPLTYHSTPPTKTLNTPLDSCNISPSESCRASCELNPDDFFFEWSKTELTKTESSTVRITCRKKLPWYSKKLKASRAYLKSLFSKDMASINCGSRRKEKTTIAAIMKSGFDYYKEEGNAMIKRRSFSIAIKRHSPNINDDKCLTTSSSDSSSSSFSRTSSATEVEGSIEAAIDHCKKSYQVL